MMKFLFLTFSLLNVISTILFFFSYENFNKSRKNHLSKSNLCPEFPTCCKYVFTSIVVNVPPHPMALPTPNPVFYQKIIFFFYLNHFQSPKAKEQSVGSFPPILVLQSLKNLPPILWYHPHPPPRPLIP